MRLVSVFDGRFDWNLVFEWRGSGSGNGNRKESEWEMECEARRAFVNPFFFPVGEST
jgi:hypothetical protein